MIPERVAIYVGATGKYPLSIATKLGGGLAFHHLTHSPNSTHQIFIEHLPNIHYTSSNEEGQVTRPSSQTVQQRKAVNDALLRAGVAGPTEVWPTAFQFPG